MKVHSKFPNSRKTPCNLNRTELDKVEQDAALRKAWTEAAMERANLELTRKQLAQRDGNATWVVVVVVEH